MSSTSLLPKISIVTSSYNQAKFIARTIESVYTQDYPAVEHIVVDGMSTDGTVDILGRYPHLKVIREPDRGQADAINKGFRAATGQILGFLNSDDTLEPGALAAVAAAMDPKAGRQVVMGRCRFIDGAGAFLGIEHPSGFEDHRRVLEIWKGHLLPQPAIFWTREVWETCGPLDVDDQLMLDYDLFCRLSRRYPFFWINRILANYRLHGESITSSMTDAQRLEQAVAVSRRYWGSPFGLQYWRILGSYARFRFNRRARAVRLMRAGQAFYRQGKVVAGGIRLAGGAALAPDVVFDVLVMPAIRPILSKIRGGLATRRPVNRPQTDAWLGRTAPHADGWAGPTLVLDVEAPAGPAQFVLSGTTVPAGLRGPLALELFLDGRSFGVRSAGTKEQFTISWKITRTRPGKQDLRIVADNYMVADDYLGNQDYRPLSYRLIRAYFNCDGVVKEIRV